jgi:Cys-tRNA(Pro)/Cys-tRNA(Cys) deacylase
VSGRGTPATQALERASVTFSVHEYDRGDAGGGVGARRGRSSYGLEAAAALGADQARVHKTLIATVDGRLVAAVVAVDRELDLRALAAVAGGRRAEMADPAAAERATGYVVGGISPLGQRRRLPMVVDSAALAHRTILVSGGRRGLQVELAPADLVALTDATVAPIGR